MSSYLDCVSLIISPALFTLIDADDYERIAARKWHYDGRGYIQAGRNTKLHRFIMGAAKGFLIDHINGNRLDNRKANLRICTNSQNQMNRGKSKNAVGIYKGVFWNKRAKKWEARIKAEGRFKYLGIYTNPADAALAYDKAAATYYGEFARTNILPFNVTPPPPPR